MAHPHPDMKHLILGLLGLMVPSASGAINLFSITLNYSGDSQYLPMFQEAKSIWEEIIPSYIDGQTGSTSFDGITIAASITAIDGAGGIVGSAGWTDGDFDDSGYALATAGSMEFDSADIGSLGGNLTTVILHEMGHVLGIGSLWGFNGLYVDGSGQYTGANGLASYRAEFNQPLATFVPVELGGGDGTMDSHWNEVDNGAGPTGFASTIYGSDMRYELMTGWLNTDQPYFISELTRGSLRDLGYNVDTLASVPEPGAALLGVATLGSCLVRRRRR